jgi:hypothetical protein
VVSPDDQAMVIIADPDAAIEDVRSAAARLRASASSAEMWLGVAGDDRYGPEHRALAVSVFFHRHVPEGTTLGELATVLDRPGWLGVDDVDVVSVAGGKLPLHHSPDETVVVLRPSLGGRNIGGVYLAVRAHLDRPSVQVVICENAGDPEARRAPIMDKGFDAALERL